MSAPVSTSRSTNPILCFNLKWNIHRSLIDEIFQKGIQPRSKIIKTKFCNSYWYAKITKQNNNELALYLHLHQTNQMVMCKFQCAIQDKNGTIKHFKFNSWKNCASNDGWGWSNWINQEQLTEKDFWHNNFLKISLNVQLKSDIKDEIIKIIKPVDNVVCSHFQNSFEILLSTENFSDVVFLVKDKMFKAHRSILAVRCRYFDSIFNSNVKESLETCIPVDNVEPEIFEAVLKYIYTNQIPNNLELIVKNLWLATDKFELKCLKEACQKYLITNLSVTNCVDLLTFVDAYSAKDLKEKVLQYIRTNINEIVVTEQWKQLEDEHVALAYEVAKAFITNP